MPHWEEWKPIIANEELVDFPRIVELARNWNVEEKMFNYWKVIKKWIVEVNHQDPDGVVGKLDGIFIKVDEFRELKLKNEELEKKIIEIYQELISNKPDFKKIKKELLEIQIKNKKRELEQLKNALESKLGQNLINDLDDLLEAQEEFTKSNNSYAQK